MSNEVDRNESLTAFERIAAGAAVFWMIAFCFVITWMTSGCQTRITAEKYPENVFPVQKVVNVGGTDYVITVAYVVTSGGWYATARSPLYAKEDLRGLDLGVETNGTVYLRLGEYNRDLSTNAVVMVKEMFSGGAMLVTSIGDAYVKIAGGGAQAMTVMDVAKKVYSAFADNGGDVSKATVTTDSDAKTLTVTDGEKCVTCTKDGECSECTDCESCLKK